MVVYIKSHQDKHKEREKGIKRSLRKGSIKIMEPYITFFTLVIAGVIVVLSMLFSLMKSTSVFTGVYTGLVAVGLCIVFCFYGVLIFTRYPYVLNIYRIEKQKKLEYIEFLKAVENRTVKSFDIITSGYEIIANVQDSSDTPKRLHLPIYEVEKIVDEKYKSKIEYAEYDYLNHKLVYYYGGEELPSKLRLDCEITEY